MAERSKPHVPAAVRQEWLLEEILEGWADLFAPMIPPERYRLLLQLGLSGIISDHQAQRLAELWGRR